MSRPGTDTSWPLGHNNNKSDFHIYKFNYWHTERLVHTCVDVRNQL